MIAKIRQLRTKTTICTYNDHGLRSIVTGGMNQNNRALTSVIDGRNGFNKIESNKVENQKLNSNNVIPEQDVCLGVIEENFGGACVDAGCIKLPVFHDLWPKR